MLDKVELLWSKALTGTYDISKLTRIAEEELRITTVLRKREGGNPLCHNGIRHLLTNPFYCVNFRWGGKIYNGDHPGMVSEEDFDSDDWERKRTVIKKLGADLKLSGRTIQFTPVKYLVPIEKQYPELKQQLELARTDSQQMKKGLREGLISQWCWK